MHTNKTSNHPFGPTQLQTHGHSASDSNILTHPDMGTVYSDTQSPNRQTLRMEEERAEICIASSTSDMQTGMESEKDI